MHGTTSSWQQTGNYVIFWRCLKTSVQFWDRWRMGQLIWSLNWHQAQTSMRFYLFYACKRPEILQVSFWCQGEIDVKWNQMSWPNINRTLKPLIIIDQNIICKFNLDETVTFKLIDVITSFVDTDIWMLFLICLNKNKYYLVR